MHAHDGGINHLHRRVMTGSQRFHDLVPDASLPPTNEAIIASGAGTIGLWQMQRHQPQMACGVVGNTLNLLPLSAAQRTWPDLLLVQPGRECPKADLRPLFCSDARHSHGFEPHVYPSWR
jgi:hypothetical protein